MLDIGVNQTTFIYSSVETMTPVGVAGDDYDVSCLEGSECADCPYIESEDKDDETYCCPNCQVSIP